MAVVKTETCTNTDGTSFASHDANWKTNAGSGQVLSNAFRLTGTGEQGFFYDDASFTADQYSQVELAALASGAFMGPSVRNGSAGVHSYVVVYTDGSSTYFALLVAGSYTDLASPSGGLFATDTIYLEANGSTFTWKRNGTTQASVTDSSLASGKPGFGGYDGGTGTRLDNIELGNLGSSAVTYNLEGYRLRNDDGSESAATWKASQDTTANVDVDTVFRMRLLLDTTNDSPGSIYKLQYQENGDDTWMDVG